MESTHNKNILFSTAGVIAVLVIAVAVNLLTQRVTWRIDTTENNIFTLSEGTRKILRSLDDPVTIRFYATRDSNTMPVMLRAYADRVEDLLREYRAASDGMVTYQVLDPKPDSEAADSAALDGVPAQQIDLTDTIYFGLSFTCLDQKSAIPFLSPERESLLEYDISRAIAEVSTFEKPVIGLLSGLDVMGSPMSMMMNPAMAPPQQDPWVVMGELQSLFEVEQLAMDGAPIPEHIDVLVILQPAQIDPRTEYAVDQYLLGGGRVIAFLDPFSVVAQGQRPQNPMMPPTAAVSATLPTLLPAWGLEFTNRVVADPVFRTVMSGPDGAPTPMAGVLSINPEGINEEDVLTAQMDNLLLVFAGAFQGEAAEGIEAVDLVRSTDGAILTDRAEAERPTVAAADEGATLTLAMRLNGTFPTAFPDGPPEDPEAGDATEDPGTAESAGTGDDSAGADGDADSNHLTESLAEGTVILVGDVDMLYDNFAVNIRNILGQQLVIPMNANIDLFLNAVEMLAGDSNLISIRSRGSVRRPFTVVREMEAAAEAQYRDRIAELEQELTETQQRLAQLQQVRPEDGEILLTPEQEEEIRNFEERRVEIRNELKMVRRELREDVEALQSGIKWSNILGMPLLIIAVGVVIGLLRRKRNSAQ